LDKSIAPRDAPKGFDWITAALDWRVENDVLAIELLTRSKKKAAIFFRAEQPLSGGLPSSRRSSSGIQGAAGGQARPDAASSRGRKDGERASCPRADLALEIRFGPG